MTKITTKLRFLRFYLAFHRYSLKRLIGTLFSGRKNTTTPTPTLQCYKDLLEYTRTTITPVDRVLPPLSTQPTLFLCNHRSGADFFIDGYLSGGAGYIGLLKSLFCFPFSCALGFKTDSLVLFRRGQTKRQEERQKLYQRVEDILKHKSLIVYPEGARNISSESLPLKHGFLKFAYQKNIPVQIIITSGKEKIWSAKTLSANWDVSCLTSRSNVFHPNSNEFINLESWIKMIEDEWNRQWKLVMDTCDN